MIRIRRIKIGEPLLQEMIDHLFDLLEVDRIVAAQDGQTHEAEAQFFSGIRKKCHGAPPFFLSSYPKTDVPSICERFLFILWENCGIV